MLARFLGLLRQAAQVDAILVRSIFAGNCKGSRDRKSGLSWFPEWDGKLKPMWEPALVKAHRKILSKRPLPSTYGAIPQLSTQITIQLQQKMDQMIVNVRLRPYMLSYIFFCKLNF